MRAKKILSTAFLALVALVVLAGCDSPAQTQARQPKLLPAPVAKPSTAPDPAIIQTQIDQRKPVKEQWIADAQQVANRVHDQQADMVIDLLRQHSFTCMPSKSGIMVLETPPANKPFVYFVAIMPHEKMPNAVWNEVATSEDFAANFFYDTDTIVVRETQRCSPTWRGIILLHEGDHADCMLFKPYNAHDLGLLSRAERDTHEFENRLLSSLGGPAYAKVLDNEVARLRTEVIRHGGMDNIIPPRTEYNSQLDRIFGKAQSQFERDVRQSHVWIHALFTLIDRDFKGDVESQKAKVMYTIYRSKGRT